jgi:hypothetical protein
MAKRQTGGGLSLRSKDATKGGGIEGALATISEIGFVDEFTYGGRQKDNPQAALRVVFDIEGQEKPWEQHYSVGPSSKYEVLADGDGIKSLGKAGGLNEKCAALAFFRALEDAAEASELNIDDLMPELDEGGQSVRELEGKQVHLTNAKFETVGGDTKELIVIASFEDGDAEEAPKSKGKSGGKSKGMSLEDATAAIIKSLVDAASKPIKTTDLGNLVYQEDKKNPDIKAMMQLCFKNSFLAGIDGVAFNKAKGTVAAE